MKIKLLLLFTLITSGLFAQTSPDYSTLPSGFVPYGTQYYKNPAGIVMIGTSAGKFRVVTNKFSLDSLAAAVDGKLATKVPNTRTVNGKSLSTDITITKSDVGLGNVDNTSDASKPISTSTQTALNGKINFSDTASLIASKYYIDTAKQDFERVFNAPNYFYVGANFYKSRVDLASKSAPSNTIAGMQQPTNIVFIGDSRLGYNSSGLRDAVAQKSKVNGLGFSGFYVNQYLNDLSFVQTGSYTITRNDNTSAANWGINGSRCDAASGSTHSFTPISKFRFDSFRIWYNKTSGGGSFTYSIDGGTAVTVNTSNATDELGLVSVNTGILANSTHTILITVTSGSVRFYGLDFYNKKQNGIVSHVLNSGGSKATDWNGNTGYTSQFISTVNPSMCTIWLGRNDAVALTTPINYINAITGVVSGLSLPAKCPVVLLTETPKGLTTTGPEDTADLTLITQYRTQLINYAKTNGHSIFDVLKYWGSYTYAQSAGMYSDAIHPTDASAFYIWNGLSENLTPVLQSELLLEYPYYRKNSIMLPADNTSGVSAVANNSNGSINETGTGIYFPSTGQMDYKLLNTTQIRYSNNGSTNAIQSYYPTVTTPTVIYAYRQGTTVNRAFDISVQADVSTKLSTQNAPFYINANALVIGPGTTANSSSILDMSAVNNKLVLFPKLTTTQRNSVAVPPVSGWLYNTDTDNFQYYVNLNGGQYLNVLNDRSPRLQANVNTAGRASLYFTPASAGSILTIPESGALEAISDDLYYTGVSGVRQKISYGTSANYTASGNGSATTIVIPHGLTGVSATSAVTVGARNAASAGISYWTSDATNISIVYTVAPASGTGNLSYTISIKP